MHKKIYMLYRVSIRVDIPNTWNNMKVDTYDKYHRVTWIVNTESQFISVINSLKTKDMHQKNLHIA